MMRNELGFEIRTGDLLSIDCNWNFISVIIPRRDSRSVANTLATRMSELRLPEVIRNCFAIVRQFRSVKYLSLPGSL